MILSASEPSECVIISSNKHFVSIISKMTLKHEMEIGSRNVTTLLMKSV